MGKSKMLCRNHHDHSKQKVTVAKFNPGAPGKRPYHCPDCGALKINKHVPEYWKEYNNIEEALGDAKSTTQTTLTSCKQCF